MLKPLPFISYFIILSWVVTTFIAYYIPPIIVLGVPLLLIFLLGSFIGTVMIALALSRKL